MYFHYKLHFGYGIIKVAGFATYYASNNTGIFSGRSTPLTNSRKLLRYVLQVSSIRQCGQCRQSQRFMQVLFELIETAMDE